MPHWTSLQPHSAPTAVISPKKKTHAPASQETFAEFLSVMMHLFPLTSHQEAELQWVRERKQKSKFSQLSLQSNFNWMSTEHTIAVLFISTNAVTTKGQIVSFRKTGLWSFVRGLQTQRQLRWLWEVVGYTKQSCSYTCTPIFSKSWFLLIQKKINGSSKKPWSEGVD